MICSTSTADPRLYASEELPVDGLEGRFGRKILCPLPAVPRNPAAKNLGSKKELLLKCHQSV
jgi:hypothetical protein